DTAPDGGVDLGRPRELTLVGADDHRLAVDHAGAVRVLRMEEHDGGFAQEVEGGVELAGLPARDEHQRGGRLERSELVDEQLWRQPPTAGAVEVALDPPRGQ